MTVDHLKMLHAKGGKPLQLKYMMSCPYFVVQPRPAPRAYQGYRGLVALAEPPSGPGPADI